MQHHIEKYETRPKTNKPKLLWPFALITSLFLLWGFAHGLLDVLDKHFQTTLHISKAQSGFVQFSLYIGYLAMAYPAGAFIKRKGYKAGILLGLALFATGAFLFYPVAHLGAFVPFLLCLFVIACGLACLETAANPYAIVLGKPEGAARRINFAQSFNGLGWILGPLIGGWCIFGAQQKAGAERFDSLTQPYLWIGCIVVVVAIIFFLTALPDIKADNSEHIQEKAPLKELLKQPFFVWGVLAQFLYVAAQTGVNSFFINYTTESIRDLKAAVAGLMAHLSGFGRVFMPQNPEQAASLILAIGGMGSFWIGRLTGSVLLKYIRPALLLTVYAGVNALLMALVLFDLGWASVIALFSCYFFMSIMFPTIFALALRGLGPLTKKAAAFLVMAVAGGAFCPPVMGLIADHAGMAIAFLIPMICFISIAAYGFTAQR